jgi:hypothetical protein
VNQKFLTIIFTTCILVTSTSANPFKRFFKRDKVTKEEIISNKGLLEDIVENTDIEIPDIDEATILEEINGKIELPSTTKNGITCTPNPLKNKTLNCVAKPLLIDKGDKIYAADEAMFEYVQGEGIAKIDISSKELFITSKDSDTRVTKSETELGDTGISIIARGDDIGGTPSEESISNTTNAQDFQIIVNSSTLVHRVTNPSNPNDKRVKLQVNEGAQGTIRIQQDDKDNLSFNTQGVLRGGVKYDSDPFSDNKVTADSNTDLAVSFDLVENEETNKSIFALRSEENSSSQGKSQLVLTDTRDPEKKNNVIAKGETSIVIASEQNKDTKDIKTSFLASSDQVVLTSKNSNNVGQTLVLDSLQASGQTDSSTGESGAVISASKLEFVDEKKNSSASADGNIDISILDNNEFTVAGVSTDKVTISTNDFDFGADGDVRISAVKFKEPKKTIDGSAVTSEVVASADSVMIRQNGKLATVDGGALVHIATLEDGSSVQAVRGNKGSVSDKNFEVNFSDNATVVNKFDKNQKLTSSAVSVSKLNGNNKDGTSFDVTNSSASLNIIGKTSKGEDILQLNSSTEKLNASNSNYEASIDNLNATVVDTHADRYGVASFDNAKLSGLLGDKDDKITLNEGVVSYYENDQTQQGNLSAKKMNLEAKDYSVNVSAIGKDGTKKNFNIFYFEEDGEQFVSIFTEDGAKVRFEGSDKDDNYADILVKAVDYYQNDEFKTLIAKEAKGNLQSGDSLYSGDFEVAKISAFETNDGSKKIYTFEDGKINLNSSEDNISSTITADSGGFSETTNDGVTQTNTYLNNGTISASEGSSRYGTLSFGSATYGSLGESGGESSSGLVINNGDFSIFDQESSTSANGQFDLMNFYQGNDITSGSIVNGNNFTISQNEEGKDNSSATFDGLNGSFVSSEKIKYGVISFDKMQASQIPVGDTDIETRITIQDGAMVFYENKEDPQNEITQLEANASKLSGNHQDYTIGITAIGDDGTPGKFNIYFLEEGSEKSIQVFGEDGKKVHITGSEKDKNFGDILFRTAQAYENDDFKQFMVTELEVKATDITPKGVSKTSTQLNIAKVAGYQAKDGSFDHFEVSNASAKVQDFEAKQDISIDTSKATFTKTNYLGTISTNLEAYDTSINIKDYSDKEDINANINMSSILYQSVENPDGKNMSFVKVNDIEFLAMDYNEMIQATGKIGEASLFDNNEMTVIDVKDLENLKVESLKEDMTALFNGKRFLKVDKKDSNGNIVSSYLLVNDGKLNITAVQDNIKGQLNLNARVFEFVKDEVTGQSRIVKADVDFNAKAEVSDSSFIPAVKLSGALKGENITTSSSTFEKNDGKIHGGTFNINADKLENLSFKAKVGFIDLVSFEAKGKDGKSISYSYVIDETQGVITLRGVYKDGDSLKTKFLFFKLGSHKEGNDAVQSLGIYLKGQSVEDHMRIMSEMASIKQVNSFFGVSDGGAISLTAGAGNKGFALELLVVNEKWAFNDSNKYKTFENPTNSVGLNVKYIKEDNSMWGAGFALTSDSKVNFDGDLKMFNQKVDSLPTTLNFNVSHRNAKGDLGVVGGLNVPLTSYVIDPTKLDSDAQFFDNGRRKANGPGAHLAVTKKFENSELRLSGGMFNDFKEPAVAISFQGTPEVLANLGKGVVNIVSGRPFDSGFKPNKRSIASQRMQERRHERIRDEEVREFEEKRMIGVEKKVDELIEYYSKKKGFKRVKEVLKIAKEYLNSPVDPQDFRKDIFSFNEQDKIEFAFYEEDKQKVEDLENIILALIENKIMVQLPMDHENRLAMYEIYKRRRYYMGLDVLSELNKINEAGVEPCEYFMMTEK